MGKAKRNKQERNNALYTAYLNTCTNIGLLAAAKVLTEPELDSFFASQDASLRTKGYDEDVVQEVLTTIAKLLLIARGEDNDQSGKTEDVRSN